MINIRAMTDADLDAVLSLRQDWLSRTSDAREPTESERRWFSAYPGNESARAFVATVDKAPVGYCLMSWLSHPTMTGTVAEIDEIHVAPEWTRRGIGRELVERSRKSACDNVNDLTVIRARVDDNSIGARAFWGSLGFEHHVLEFTDYLD